MYQLFLPFSDDYLALLVEDALELATKRGWGKFIDDYNSRQFYKKLHQGAWSPFSYIHDEVMLIVPGQLELDFDGKQAGWKIIKPRNSSCLSTKVGAPTFSTMAGDLFVKEKW